MNDKQQWMIEQLTLIREVKHINFIHDNVQTQITNEGISNENDETVKGNENEREDTKDSDDTALWPKNTILITGDSMLCGIEEKRLSKKFNVKVRPRQGANICDMYDHIYPYLRKKTKYIIIHISTNDTSMKDKSSEEIFDQLLELKRYIESKEYDIKVTISCPIVRSDNGLANLKIFHLRNKLKSANISIIDNENINYEYLGKKGLHMSSKGITRLAMNFIGFIRRL